MSNYDQLVNAKIIDPNFPPDATDLATINNLNPNDVQGLINVFQNASVDPNKTNFLTRNCNGGGGTVTPGSGNSRIIGIVF